MQFGSVYNLIVYLIFFCDLKSKTAPNFWTKIGKIPAIVTKSKRDTGTQRQKREATEINLSKLRLKLGLAQIMSLMSERAKVPPSMHRLPPKL